MLHIDNIKSLLEVKATADLPISDKQLEKILAEFKGDWNEALTILWLSLGIVITDKMVSESIFSNTILQPTTDKITKVYTNWREDVLKPLYGDIISTTGKQTAGIISDAIGSIMRFDITRPAIVNYINTETLSLVHDLSSSAFSNLQQTIIDGINNGWDKSLVKDMMRGNIKLTENDLKFIRRTYLKNIESETLRGINELKLSPSKARARAVRFAKKQRRILVKNKQNLRIARLHRTETVRMKHFADLESLSQAELTGKINSATKTWVRTNFTDSWDSTKINDGKTIPVNGLFKRGSKTTASSLAYPSEINEHCYLKYKVKFKKVA